MGIGSVHGFFASVTAEILIRLHGSPPPRGPPSSHHVTQFFISLVLRAGPIFYCYCYTSPTIPALSGVAFKAQLLTFRRRDWQDPESTGSVLPIFPKTGDIMDVDSRAQSNHNFTSHGRYLYRTGTTYNNLVK